MGTLSFKVYIPARYASTRLPGKALRDLAGRSMLERVYAQALESGAEEVIIATDDSRIEAAALGFGARVCMTSPAHESGSERLAEAIALRGEAPETLIVNLQGDEPFMPPAVIHQVAACLALDTTADMATVCEPLAHLDDWMDPNIVKVVRDERGRALYFSRAPIPWPREADEAAAALPEMRRHVGLYAYRAGFLARFVRWSPSTLERLEKLEQLRALANGAVICVPDSLAACGVGIDTSADLERARQLLGSGGH